ncbi:EAL and HDOD domain-containing protein [Andreprevotia chitinilytica]|uniref:EAL and HDOD domain-containing protein n=1 Tax=Andreprevotia chitinilytica TaxID=396808 RepID=UPI000689C078|nr:HDOD domain-containing protein [Andreprevotia chitinilytica]
MRLHADPAVLPRLAEALAAEPALADLPLLYPVEGMPLTPLPGKLMWLCSPGTDPVPEHAVAEMASIDEFPPAGPVFFSGIHTPSELAVLPTGAWCCGAWPTVASARGSKPRPAQPVLLELLGLIARDADSPDIEAVFAKAPQLSVSLLKLVNSVAISGVTKAGSLRQAITVLGRRQLQRWLQLLMYAEQFGPGEMMPPLLVVAALRARRLENWARAGWLTGCPAESAFFTGMLSCLDCLFGMPMADLLAPLPLPDDVVAALTVGKGELGQALARIVKLEHGVTADFDYWPNQCAWSAWVEAEVDAVAWTRRLFSMVAT